MKKIGVLVVDDTATIRRVVADVINSDPGLEVLGMARNGAHALELVPELEPDIITLDMEMPRMGGIETLEHLREKHDDIPVIVFSSVTERGAEITIDALLAGANDYVTKPAGLGGPEEARAHIRKNLLPKIRLLGTGRSAPRTDEPAARSQGASTPSALAVPEAPAERVDLIAVGVSTGGPTALSTLFSSLDEPLPVPIALVQHMPPLFTRALAERLSKVSPIRFRECDEPLALRPGEGLIAAGGNHMRLAFQGERILAVPDDSEPENFCRPSADVLFRSAGHVYGPHVLGVVMTGMGQDGLAGARVIRQSGGQILAQDEKSSVVWGMAGFVSRAGYANRTLPLEALGAEIQERVQVGRRWRPSQNVPNRLGKAG